MKTKTLRLVALLAAGALLAGCDNTQTPTGGDVEIANPASVYCEENWGTLKLEDGSWLCMFNDWSYCEEWSYQRWECQPGEIFYNTIDDGFIDDVEQKYDWNGSSEIYSQEDLQAAVDAIMNVVNNEWQVKVEVNEIFYAGDDTAKSNLEYCQSFNPEITECAIFSTNFYIPAQNAQMAGAFEPDSNIEWWSWTLGKNSTGEWEVLTNGLG